MSQSAKEFVKEYDLATGEKQISDSESSAIFAAYDSEDEDSSWSSSTMYYIKLEGNPITFDGDGAVVNSDKIAITSAVTYYIRVPWAMGR